MTPVAGTQSPATHHVTLATDTDTQGFMLVPGTYRGPERLNDFAPRIAAGSETALREDLWDIWSQDEAREGIDQYTFQNKNRIYRSDGNVFFGRKQAITLQAIAASSDAAKAATTPMLIESGTNIVLVGVGTKVRRYNVSGASWSDSTTTLGASAIWLHRHGSTDYCALGTANDMVSSTNNGDTWAADTVSFRFNGLATFQGLLYGWNGATLRCKNGTGGAWTNGSSWTVGDATANITNAIEAFGMLLIRTEDGLFYFDGTKVVPLRRKRQSLYSGNKCLGYHSDGFAYYNEQGRIKKMSLSSGSIANEVDVTPEMIGDEGKELYGHGIPIWLWSGPSDNLFVAFDDGESVYPEVLYHNGQGWHQFYRGASGDTMRAGGYSRLAARTWFNDGATRYREHTTLRDFPAASYATSGVWETSDHDGGLPFMYKAYRDVSVEVRNMAAGQTLKIEYSIDKGTTWVVSGTSNSNGKLMFAIDPAAVAVGAQHLRLRFTLASNSSSNTPVLIRWAVSFLTRPNPVYGYEFTARLGEGQDLITGAETLTVAQRLDFLRQLEAAYAPVTFTDMWGQTRKVYVSRTSVTQESLDEIEDERLVKVTLVEALAPARYGAAYYGASYYS